MQRFEITIDGVAQADDFASQELADAAATAARHKDENKGKQVIARPKAATPDASTSDAGKRGFETGKVVPQARPLDSRGEQPDSSRR